MNNNNNNNRNIDGVGSRADVEGSTGESEFHVGLRIEFAQGLQ